MPTERPSSGPAAAASTPDNETPQRRPLAPAAERALAEAAARRTERERGAIARPKETNGPAGPEPTRYGDWENKGIASDF
jgi:hypothetical protein